MRPLSIVALTWLALLTAPLGAWAQDGDPGTADPPTVEPAPPPATTEEKTEGPKPVTVTSTWDYDKAALKKAVDEAEEKDGVKSASIVGQIKREYSDGLTSTIYAEFTQELKGDTYSAVTAEELGTDGWFNASNVWMMVATFLVFIMHLGFATLETGLERAKNATNILFKNTAIITIGMLTYAIMGFNLAYPGGEGWMVGEYLGFAGFGVGFDAADAAARAANSSPGYTTGYPYWTDFLFQAMFAATAATIVSGAVAGRVKLLPFLIFSTIYVMIAYPIVVSWEWGTGFLDDMGFHDFAGSTLVHSVGGWGALIGAILLGPRMGKYVNGTVKAIPGHNLPLATIGVFLLWLGWFGFNGGSVLSGDATMTSYVLVTTSLAAAGGVFGAMVTSWFIQKKPDLTMALNGALAGLVGITAGADVISPGMSVVVGVIAGVLVVTSVLVIDQVLKIDDPVGAISVHLVCGIWGTLAVGIFKMDYMANGDAIEDGAFGAQLVGVLVTGVFCLIFAGALFALLKYTMGIRVDAEEELRGLDIGEHGQEAYAGFQIFATQ